MKLSFLSSVFQILILLIILLSNIILPDVRHVSRTNSRMYSYPVKLYSMKTNLENIGTSKTYMVESNSPPINFKADVTKSYKVLYKVDNLTSGIYFYRITANGYTETKKMIRMK